MDNKPGAIVRELARRIALETKPAKKVYVRRTLARAFIDCGIDPLESDELADRWAGTFSESLQERIDTVWAREGVDTPLQASPRSDDLFVGVGHQLYSGALTTESLDILEQISQMDDKALNLAAAIALCGAGATHVFVVDGPNDGGVDVIGTWDSGSFAGLTACIQCKAWGKPLAQQDIEDTFNKFQTGLSKPIWSKYRGLINVASLPGWSRSFAVLSRDSFGPTGFESGRDLAVICIGPRRLACALSDYMRSDTFGRVVAIMCSSKYGRTTNLVPVIRELTTDGT